MNTSAKPAITNGTIYKLWPTVTRLYPAPVPGVPTRVKFVGGGTMHQWGVQTNPQSLRRHLPGAWKQ